MGLGYCAKIVNGRRDRIVRKRLKLKRMMARAKKSWIYITDKYRENGRDTGDEKDETE